jgi:hypothetical protein
MNKIIAAVIAMARREKSRRFILGICYLGVIIDSPKVRESGICMQSSTGRTSRPRLLFLQIFLLIELIVPLHNPVYH